MHQQFLLPAPTNKSIKIFSPYERVGGGEEKSINIITNVVFIYFYDPLIQVTFPRDISHRLFDVLTAFL